MGAVSLSILSSGPAQTGPVLPSQQWGAHITKARGISRGTSGATKVMCHEGSVIFTQDWAPSEVNISEGRSQ